MSTVAAERAAVLAPLRDWLRTEDTVAGARVYAHGLPQAATLPAVVLTKIGLTPDGTATEQTMVQADCWANKGEAGVAEHLAAEIKTLLETSPPEQLPDSTVRFLGARIESEVSLPDPDDGTPRHVVTAIVTTLVVA